jgi:hypothetical protein
MRLVRAERREAPPLGLIFGGVLVLGLLAARVWLGLGLFRPQCPLHAWTGLPCPTCGTTRMLEALFAGRLLEAFSWNPLVFCALGAVALWAAGSLVPWALRRGSWRVVLDPGEGALLRVLAILAVALNWGYLIWRGV